MTGISVSTLSKIENGLVSPTYEKILQLCEGLKIEVSDLLSPGELGGAGHVVMTRRSISRQFQGTPTKGEHFEYTFLSPDVAHKRIVPVHLRVTARSEEEMGEWYAHFGEEFVVVLSGKVRLFCEYYEPADLDAGDSVYIDSAMPHNFMALGDAPCEILVCHSSQTPNLAQTLRDVIKSKLQKEH